MQTSTKKDFMQERPKEYNMGYNIGEKRRKGEINAIKESALLEAAMRILIAEGLNHSILIQGLVDGLKGSSE